MNITIIGTGYVGLVTGTCFSDMGNEVYCVDVIEEKIDSLKKGIVPIYEPGLEELIKRNYERGNLHFTTNLKEGLDNSELCFIAVGTPMGEDGSADLQYVRQVAKQIGQTIIHDMIVINPQYPLERQMKLNRLSMNNWTKEENHLKFLLFQILNF